MSRFMQQQFAPLPTEMEALAREAGDAQSSTPARHPVPPPSHTPHRTFLPGANNSVPSGQSHQTPPAAPSFSTPATRKRPAPHDAPDSEPGSSKTKERRITRTCDQCRNKAATCSGFKPCFMCTSKGRTCTYDRPYARGTARTPPPPPPGDDGTARNWAQPFNEDGRARRDKDPDLRTCDHCRRYRMVCSGKLPCDVCFQKRIECKSTDRGRRRPPSVASGDDGQGEDMSFQETADAASVQDAPDIEPLQFSTRYADEETPPLMFLHKAWQKIAAAQALGRPGHPSPTLPSPDQLVLASGDLPFSPSKTTQEFPVEQEKWHLMQDNFISGWTETFHFLHRLTARAWVDAVYRNWQDRAPLEFGIGPAKAAIAVMTMALGTMFNYPGPRPAKKALKWAWLWTVSNGDQLFLTTLRLTDSEPGPPTLESVQARLLQVFYLLSTCRLSQAWYIFGNAIHMLTSMGLHRRRGRNRGLGPEIVVSPEYAKIQCERRTFWSAYVMDKQIAMMSGRPPYLNLDNIDQALPDCVNDEDMGREGPFRQHKGDCYLEALVEQAKLSKLVEKILRQVYTLDDTPEDERLEHAMRLGKALEEWKAQLPFLMGAVRPPLLSLTWRRQQDVLRMSHWHAQILAYRPFITAPYPTTDRAKKQITDFAIRACINAARAALAMTANLAREQVEREKSHFHTLLHAHHLTYLAASVVLLIPHIRERQKLLGAGSYNNRFETNKLFELAQKAIQALIQTTNKYSPARKWAVILLELRDEACRQIPPDKDQGAEEDNQNRDDDLDSPDGQLLEDALRAHWEADIAREALMNPSSRSETSTDPGPVIVPRLWDKWKCADWLDLDSAAFGPIHYYEKGEVPIAVPRP